MIIRALYNLVQRRHFRLVICLILVTGLFAKTALAQCASPDINAPETVAWVNKLIASALGQDDACRAGAPDRDSFAADSACNIFVGRVMARIYGLTDFAKDNQTFLLANEIAVLLPTFSDWEDLGTADDQSTLNAGADAANNGYIVLAVWANADSKKAGHVALIGPGPLTPSDKWKLSTPVAASFKLDNPDAAFLGKPLACAFGSDKKSNTHIWKYSQPAVVQ